MKNYYVYALIDPIKPIIYNYENFTFNFEPFYIGISFRKDRLTEHLNLKSNCNQNKHKFNKLKKLKSLGFNKSDICLILKENLTKKEATILEIKLIQSIGRIDLKTGTLTNHTDGGDGIYNPSKKEREKISQRMSGEGNPFFQKTHSEETKQKIRETKKLINQNGENNPNYGNKWTDEQKKHLSENKKNATYLKGENNHAKRPEVRAKLSKSKLGLKNPNASLWKLTSPFGEEYIIKGGLKTNLKSYGVDYQSFKKDSNKTIRKNFKGWILIKL